MSWRVRRGSGRGASPPLGGEGQRPVFSSCHVSPGVEEVVRPCPCRRSEEHTSELQSPDHLGCRPLLEKKREYTRSRAQGSNRCTGAGRTRLARPSPSPPAPSACSSPTHREGDGLTRTAVPARSRRCAT